MSNDVVRLNCYSIAIKKKLTKEEQLMALLGAYSKKSILKAAVKQTVKARTNEGAKADQLFISAYEGFADVVKDDLV
ncbi:MAG: hypothetical protein KAR12_00425, partial [Methylococcales bacterium]|nr:hypothetical protein [Methylococcales bacterium]